jgi:hypothetical protein
LVGFKVAAEASLALSRICVFVRVSVPLLLSIARRMWFHVGCIALPKKLSTKARKKDDDIIIEAASFGSTRDLNW